MASTYIMEDNREAERLSRKVDPAGWVADYFAAYLRDGTSVLDVGCGPGAIAAEIATRYPLVTVQGVDLSQERLTYARSAHQLPNLAFEVADSYKLPFSNDRFDLVYSRLMLEYLKHPEVAVCEMARTCKPGGYVMLQDLDGQLAWHYPTPPFAEELQSVLDALSATGHDVFVGRKLFSLARQAGLEKIAVRIDPYHLYAGAISAKEYEEWDLKLEIALPQIAKVHGESKATQLKRDFLAYLKDEDTLTYSVIFTVVGVVPS